MARFSLAYRNDVMEMLRSLDEKRRGELLMDEYFQKLLGILDPELPLAEHISDVIKAQHKAFQMMLGPTNIFVRLSRGSTLERGVVKHPPYPDLVTGWGV
jgi:hypothetical protein